MLLEFPTSRRPEARLFFSETRFGLIDLNPFCFCLYLSGELSTRARGKLIRLGLYIGAFRVVCIEINCCDKQMRKKTRNQFRKTAVTRGFWFSDFSFRLLRFSLYLPLSLSLASWHFVLSFIPESSFSGINSGSCDKPN